MPSASGWPTCTGAPCAIGSRAEISTTRATSRLLIGRMLTTISPLNRAGRHAGDVGAVHRHVAALVDVAQAHAGRLHRRLEREAAADQERAPGRRARGSRPRRAPRRARRRDRRDSRARRSRCSAPGAHEGSSRTGRQHLDQRARLRVALAEEQEVERLGLRHDHQVGLDPAGRVAGGRASKLAAGGWLARKAEGESKTGT